MQRAPLPMQKSRITQRLLHPGWLRPVHAEQALPGCRRGTEGQTTGPGIPGGEMQTANCKMQNAPSRGDASCKRVNGGDVLAELLEPGTIPTTPPHPQGLPPSLAPARASTAGRSLSPGKQALLSTRRGARPPSRTPAAGHRPPPRRARLTAHGGGGDGRARCRDDGAGSAQAPAAPAPRPLATHSAPSRDTAPARPRPPPGSAPYLRFRPIT